MNFDLFFNEVEKSKIKLGSVKKREVNNGILDNEALFQLPFISLVILVLAKDKRKPKVEELGRLVGECLELTMPAFKKSKQKISWSANLRIRTINAMTFLEAVGLIHVNNRKGRLSITESGKKLIESALKNEDNLSCTLSEIKRSYRNICVSRQLDMELV